MNSSFTSSRFDTFIEKKYIPLDIRVKIFGAFLILAIPIGLFIFFCYLPKNKEITTLTGQKNTLLQEIKMAKIKANNLDKHKKEMEETEKIFRETAKLLPKKKEIPILLRNISDLGKSSGLDFLSFKPGAEVARDFYAEIPVDISIRGPYHNMGYFLDKVSKLDRVVTVDNIKMSSPTKESSEMLLNSSCRLTTYRFTNVQKKSDDKKKKKKK